MPEKPTTNEIRQELLAIERRMGEVGKWNIYERWNSGRYLVDLRNPETHYLPKGQLTTLAATLKVSRRELSDRMRVADTYRTASTFKHAAQRAAAVARGGGVWTALLRSLPPTREARTGSTRKAPDWLAKGFEALGHVLAGKLLSADQLRQIQKAYDILEDHQGAEDPDDDEA